MKALPLIPQRFAVLAAALVSSLALALGGCMRAPQSSTPRAAQQALASGTGSVYSANEGEDSISRIDLATRRVTTLQLPVTPHNVQISHDKRRLFAVGSMAGQMEKSSPVAAQGGHEHATAKETGGLVIFDATAANAGNATLVTMGRAPAQVVVHAVRGSVVGTIPTAASSHGLRLSPDGREIYVAATKGNAVSVIDVSLRDDNAVAVVDTQTRRLITAIPVGRSPIQLFATPDGSRVFIANTFAGTVSTIDTATQRVIGSVRVGRGPGGITYRPGSR